MSFAIISQASIPSQGLNYLSLAKSHVSGHPDRAESQDGEPVFEEYSITYCKIL